MPAVVCVEDGMMRYYCPGCNRCHTIPIAPDGTEEPWDFNDNLEKPTVLPAIVIEDGDGTKVCQHFITDGKISYLENSKHALAGHVVEMKDCSNCDEHQANFRSVRQRQGRPD